MKKKILLLFLVLMSTALTMSGQYSIQRYMVYLNGVVFATYNGSNSYVTATPDNGINQGGEVELSFTPPSGYILDDIRVMYNNSVIINVYIRDGHYYFKMPNNNVTVDVNFVPNRNNPNPVNVSPLIRHGSVIPYYSTANPNRLNYLDFYPDPQYQIGTVTATVFSGFFYGRSYATIEPTPGYDWCSFFMPDRPVDVFANFIPESGYVPPYTLKVPKYHSEVPYTTVEINGVLRYPSYFDTDYNYYDKIDCNDYIVVTNYPNPSYWTTYCWVNGSDYVNYYNFLNTNTFVFDMPCCDCELDYETFYGPYKIIIPPGDPYTINQPKHGQVRTLYDWYYSDAGEPVYLVVTPDPGYELASLEVHGTQTGTITFPNPIQNTSNYKFNMPSEDVIVSATFRKKTYTITLDPTFNGYLKATNLTANPPTTVDTWNCADPRLSARIKDVISLGSGSYEILKSCAYYIISKTSDGTLLGEMAPNYNQFTMPPCDLTISALFSYEPLPQPPHPLQFQVSTADNLNGGGTIQLHEWTELAELSKSRSLTGWDDEENYGWSTAIPGQPMYFTVIPDVGYQVKKSDIKVKLLAVSEGEDGEVIILDDCVVQEGFDISGPDGYVTEPTDFSFIFDVPDGYYPWTVQVAFDATFTPVDYNITVNPSIEHGTVMAPATARMDELVTFNVIPEPGYRLTGITITSVTSGLFVDVVDNNQFTMPACNVLVTAEFEEAEFELGDVNGDGVIGVKDVATIIDYLLTGDESLIVFEAADCSPDGVVNVKDMSALIGYLLTGSW